MMAMSYELLYDLLYALIACNGRQEVLFGNGLELSREAFARSLAAEAFPELWFEIPLLGEPWFDLHALTSRSSLHPGMTFSPERTGGCPEAFEWFAAQQDAVRQLALSWDVSKGDVEHPAVQLLVYKSSLLTTCSFLDAVGRGDAAPAYRTFVRRLPKDWFACYTGVFPGRTEPFLRVECIPSEELQSAYATDPDLLWEHLRQVGVDDLSESVVSGCQDMLGLPFRIEFQFDVTPDGSAGPTFSASARFARPPREDEWEGFDPDGVAGELMSKVQASGLADDRWRLLGQTAVAKRVSQGGASTVLYCYPAFLKVRWREGDPVDAKAYLIAGVQ